MFKWCINKSNNNKKEIEEMETLPQEKSNNNKPSNANADCVGP